MFQADRQQPISERNRGSASPDSAPDAYSAGMPGMAINTPAVRILARFPDLNSVRTKQTHATVGLHSESASMRELQDPFEAESAERHPVETPIRRKYAAKIMVGAGALLLLAAILSSVNFHGKGEGGGSPAPNADLAPAWPGPVNVTTSKPNAASGAKPSDVAGISTGNANQSGGSFSAMNIPSLGVTTPAASTVDGKKSSSIADLLPAEMKSQATEKTAVLPTGAASQNMGAPKLSEASPAAVAAKTDLANDDVSRATPWPRVTDQSKTASATGNEGTSSDASTGEQNAGVDLQAEYLRARYNQGQPASAKGQSGSVSSTNMQTNAPTINGATGAIGNMSGTPTQVDPRNGVNEAAGRYNYQADLRAAASRPRPQPATIYPAATYPNYSPIAGQASQGVAPAMTNPPQPYASSNDSTRANPTTGRQGAASGATYYQAPGVSAGVSYPATDGTQQRPY